jgi:hypothetical protein
MTTTADSVRALAPDDSSFKAARGLCAVRQWPTLGRNDEAIWGECQGSGSKPYQTQVDLRADAPSFRCSCPSRKFPCKHGLALLLLGVEQAPAFQANEPPPWVAEWLTARTQRSEQKAARAAEPASAPDPQARAKREAKRHQRIGQAAADLQRWLGDLVDRGLGSLGAGQRGEVETMAARMVDAQAPGLAARLRELALEIGTGDDWIGRALGQMGLLQLACEGIAQRDALSPELRAEIDAVAGWSVDKTELLATAPPLLDHWTVIGQRVSELDKRLSERRVWLHGAQSDRFAYLLDYRFAAAAFERHYIVGSCFEGALHFHPGFAGLRATQGEIKEVRKPRWPQMNLSQLLDGVAARVARSPWTWWQPCWLQGAQLQRLDARWRIHADGHAWALQLSDQHAFELLASSGGEPMDVFAETRGEALVPLAAVSADGLWQGGSA